MSGSPAMRMRSGVEPPDAASPTGLTSRTVSPRWSAIARRIASPLAPAFIAQAARPVMTTAIPASRDTVPDICDTRDVRMFLLDGNHCLTE